MTLLIAFQQSHFRCFKAFYMGFVGTYWRQAFPRLVSYSRFIEYVPAVLALLADYLKSLLGRCHGISFVDSTALAVCHNRRIASHKVFATTARRGKTSVGWFFGFKIHLGINEQGEIIALAFTAGNVHDIPPVPALVGALFGKSGETKFLPQCMRTKGICRNRFAKVCLKKALNSSPKFVRT